MLGYADDEVGDSIREWSDRVHPEDLPNSWQVVQNHLKRGDGGFIFECRMKARDGSWKWMLSRGRAIERSPDGSPMRIIGTHTDITARKMVGR